MSIRLDHANLTTRDLEATLRFLRTAFSEFRIRGRGPAMDGGEWVHLGNDDTYLALHQASRAPAEPWVPYEGRPGLNHLGFEVDDVEAGSSSSTSRIGLPSATTTRSDATVCARPPRGDRMESTHRTRRRALRLVLTAAALALAIWLATPLAFIPRFRSALVGTPADVGLAYETLTLDADGGALRLVGWWMPADAARGVVVLLHDGASNRSFLWSNGLVLARGLHERGYHVLAPDLRGHGESDAGAGVPIGANLAPDVSAWLDAIEPRSGGLPVAVVGFGLGGQVAIYAGARDSRIRAVVADSTWADMKSSVAVSIPSATGLPRWYVRSAIWCAEHVYGVDFAQSRAVDVVGALSDRLLLVTNEEDPQVPRRQLRWLARAAGHAEVWVSPAPLPDHPLYASSGPWGTHSRTAFLYPEEYARRVGDFLAEHDVGAAFASPLADSAPRDGRQ